MKYLGRIEDSADAANKGYVDGGLAPKADAPTIVTLAAPTAITLVDNCEYYLSNVSDLTISYPTTGHWEVWITLDTASDGTVTVTLPAGSRYIGAVPDFGAGESWEISIRDGVVVAGKAEAVT